MFCCMTGSKKEPLQKAESKALPKNKKPEDFMRDDIPLALSEKIRFTFDRSHKWNCEIEDNGRARRKDEGSLKQKLQGMREKLKRMRKEDDELNEQAKKNQIKQEELGAEEAKLRAECQILQWAIANNELQIRKCKQRLAI